jgi:hypothetical protein
MSVVSGTSQKVALMAILPSRPRTLDRAGQTGAETYSAWFGRLGRALLRRGRWRKLTPPGLVMFAGEDAPRDLDDPLTDPKVQTRIGKTIAKQLQRPKK